MRIIYRFLMLVIFHGMLYATSDGIPSFPLLKPDGSRLILSDPIPIPTAYKPLFTLLADLNNPDLTLLEGYLLIDEHSEVLQHFPSYQHPPNLYYVTNFFEEINSEFQRLKGILATLSPDDPNYNFHYKSRLLMGGVWANLRCLVPQ